MLPCADKTQRPEPWKLDLADESLPLSCVYFCILFAYSVLAIMM
jgi:hypothetical protein